MSRKLRYRHNVLILLFGLLIVLSACSAEEETAMPDSTVSSGTTPFLATATSSPEPIPTEIIEQASKSDPADNFAGESGMDVVDQTYPSPGDQVAETPEMADPTPDTGDSQAQDSGEKITDIDAPPPPKTSLVASDPLSVDLSSGDPKLVEFFAFW